MKDYRKRHLRVLPSEGGYYVHVMSRTRGQALLFGAEEKEVFVGMMRKWADFSGMGVVTHCVMGNHFHMLLYVPPVAPVELKEVVRRLRRIWEEDRVEEWFRGYALIRGEAEQAAYVKAVTDRMCQLPEMMRALKQAFSRWYNVRHDTRGALWEDRYKSVVLEAGSGALLAVSAYIDLNPVRAGLCGDPLSYRWSGYGAAVGGVGDAREGLKHLVMDRLGGVGPYGARRAEEVALGRAGVDWREVGNAVEARRQEVVTAAKWTDVQKIYRCWLYAKGVEGDGLRGKGASRGKGEKKQHGWTREALEEVYASGGAVPQAEMLRIRCAYMTRGMALGSEAYVGALFARYRERFGEGRKHAGLKMKGEWGGLRVLRRSGDGKSS